MTAPAQSAVGAMEAVALLPCPMCGKPAVLREKSDNWTSYIRYECEDGENCDGRDAFYKSSPNAEAEARENWNRRARLESAGGLGEADGEGVWPHPISGWVKERTFCPVDSDHCADPYTMMQRGWQPVSHVPPSHVFDPSAAQLPNAAGGGDAGREIAWSECDDCAADWPKDATCCPECGGDTRSIQYVTPAATDPAARVDGGGR